MASEKQFVEVVEKLRNEQDPAAREVLKREKLAITRDLRKKQKMSIGEYRALVARTRG